MKKLIFIVTFLIVSVFSAANNYLGHDIVVTPQKAMEIISSDDNTVVIDVRKAGAFATGHIEGSYDVWRPMYSAESGEYDYGGMRSDREKLADLLGSLGVSSDTTIILLGTNANYDASRFWWQLDMYGHDDILMIDGGIDGWIDAGMPVATGEAVRPEAVKYQFPRDVDTSKLAELDDVKEAVAGNGTVIIDTRTDFEHDGLAQFDGAFTKGRIPSEYYIEWNRFVNEDNTFKSKDEIKAILAENGITEEVPVIAYCQSGVRSAHMTFVLGQLLGWEDVKNYDGSWIEWSYNAVNGNVEVEKPGMFSVVLSYLTSREKMELVITSLGAWGPLAYILIYALVTITCLSVLPVTLVGGLVFGGVMGVVYTAIGASLGLSLAFIIARYIARKPIEKKFGNSEVFKKIDKGVKEEGWFVLATTRLLPVFPFGIQNYVYGLTSISFLQYSLLSTIFILPGTSVFVLLAGAVASGDKATAIKMSVTASLIFFALTLVTKFIAKKSKNATKTA